MVRAELIYNPYLLETDVRFNGSEPKINSLVERYRSGRLQDWIKKLPGIFHNEMNGWDFTLDFSGTKLDFDCLQAAFDSVGVSRESVCLFHKNELGSAIQKENEIALLLSWFENNPNRKFDFRLFRESNSHLIEDGYSLVVLQGVASVAAFDEVSIESISEIGELEESSLENTPILFCIDEENYRKLRYNLPELLKRDDVLPAQLFFHIDSTLNRSQVERMIRDLGVAHPQVADTLSDCIIKAYLDTYPKTAYIQRMIAALREVATSIGDVLKEENERSIGVNSSIRQRIDELDETIQYLKATSEQIAQRDNYVAPLGLASAKNGFSLKIMNWRKRKIKMTSDIEAGGVAVEFKQEIIKYFSEFIAEIQLEFNSAENNIRSFFADVYSSARFEDGYAVTQDVSVDLSGYELPKFVQSLLELKTERMVEQPENVLLGLFKKPSDTKELVREVTYQYMEWRNYAAEQAQPVLDEVVEVLNEVLSDFYGRVAEDYLEHLKLLIAQKSKEKAEVADGLSEDEQKLQEDNDWFALVQEKLLEIKRR